MVRAFAVPVCVVGVLVGSTFTSSQQWCLVAGQKSTSVGADLHERLVEQLNSPEFKKREAADKALLAQGAKAIPAVRAGTKHRDPEVAQRCERLLVRIQTEELLRFQREFTGDVTRSAKFDHPIWKRYVATVGDSKPARELLALVLKRDAWTKALDAAEANPAQAPELYQAAVRDVGQRYVSNLLVSFLIPIWPCDQPEEVAFLLMLGSYKGTDPDFPLSYQKAQNRQFVEGESRIRHARGLGLAFRGKRLDIDPMKADRSIEVDDGGGDAAESSKVMLKLLGHWLEQRNLWKVVAEHLQGLSDEQEKLLLPIARRVIADKNARVLCRAAWIGVLRRFGDSSDAARLTPLFEDKTGMDWPSTTRYGDGAGNLINQAQVREVAIGSAIYLRGGNPGDYGFYNLSRREAAKKRTDDIHSTLFTIVTGSNEEKDKILLAAIRWLAEEATKRKSKESR